MIIDYEDIDINNSNLSNEDKNILKEYIEIFNDRAYAIEEYSNEELIHIYEIAKFNPRLQIMIWTTLSDEVIRSIEDIGLFEETLDNKFGDYINGVDKKALVKMINESRNISGAMDANGNILYWNVSLLGQMNSPVFDNEIVKEAFSFEQLLEIVSIKEAEDVLIEVMRKPNARDLLVSIGKDPKAWQDKFQYIMNLEDSERNSLIDEFGIDGTNIINQEAKRREDRFEAMETGYFEDDEYGIIDCEIGPNNMLMATFGLIYEEAKELLKKYAVDFEKLDIQTDDDKEIYRKMQIMRELLEQVDFDDYDEYLDHLDYYSDYYKAHKDELIEISKKITPFFKVDLERDFLDLYARQYDRKLGVEADRVQDVSYDGKTIPVYEVSGDFLVLIRGEDNVSKENEQNFWDITKAHLKGLCSSTIRQDYIRTPNLGDSDDICYVGKTSCKDGELRMASTTNIESKGANIALSNIGLRSDYGNGIVFRVPDEQINNSREINNETITARNVTNEETGLMERSSSDYIIYIQDTNDINPIEDKGFEVVEFAASKTGWPILIIPREKCAQREEERLQGLKDKLLGKIEYDKDDTDESIIKELIVSFNNNREGINTSKGLKGKYFTEGEHAELVGIINERLSEIKETNPERYEELVQEVGKIYNDEIDKYYSFRYDRIDGKGANIDETREHVKPYEDFIMAHERNIFNLSGEEKDDINNVIKEISKTSYYERDENHTISHIQKVIMFSGILAKNENLSKEETKILLVAAAFHDSGRDGITNEHAEESAKQIGRYFEDNPNNPFGITKDNISMIQAAIEYHEYKEEEKGITDKRKIEQLMMKYKIDYDNKDSLVKVCDLLKDADALDRARFGKRSETRASLDAKYLKSETAKSISMISFSEECNEAYVEKENKENRENLSIDEAQEVLRRELEEFNRETIQMASVFQVTSEVDVISKRDMLTDWKENQKENGNDKTEEYKR